MEKLEDKIICECGENLEYGAITGYEVVRYISSQDIKIS